jgi:flagellar basal-body rod protein FlgC
MDLLSAMEVTASGLSAQRTRLNIISQNLANAHVTRTADGGPYRRQVPVFSAVPFSNYLTQAMDTPPHPPGADPKKGVFVQGIYQDNEEFKRVYDPGHPDADDEGYVLYPNVDTVTEMTNLINASRSYEAGVTAVNASKSMAMKALEIGR